MLTHLCLIRAAAVLQKAFFGIHLVEEDVFSEGSALFLIEEERQASVSRAGTEGRSTKRCLKEEISVQEQIAVIDYAQATKEYRTDLNKYRNVTALHKAQGPSPLTWNAIICHFCPIKSMAPLDV
ncbi:hypothetical protein AB4K20DRAFT_1863312 [Rhizopus microsporus]|uniref:Uncharacterized protein n=1 Tax=Rhizopus microsporus TaxID=58291 RepID=A0A1X0S909_RHIZD|nr:hypothetical protein BCV71DRAFT_232926 [Rhizopus microsporus]